MLPSRPKQTWLHLFHCFTTHDTDRRTSDDQLVFRAPTNAAGQKAMETHSQGTYSMGDVSDKANSGDIKQVRRSCDRHSHQHKRMSDARCESACSAASTSDWTVALALAKPAQSEGLDAEHAPTPCWREQWSQEQLMCPMSPLIVLADTSPMCVSIAFCQEPGTTGSDERSQHQQAAAALASCTESPCTMQTSSPHAAPCGSPCSDSAAALMDSQLEVQASSDTAATAESLIQGAVPATASSSPPTSLPTTAHTSGLHLLPSTQTSSLYTTQAEDLEFKQPRHRSHPNHATPCFPGLTVIQAGMFSHEELETGPLLDHEAGWAVHQLLLSSAPSVSAAAPSQLARATQLLLDRRASHEGATTAAAPGSAAAQRWLHMSEPCAMHVPHHAAPRSAAGAGFGIYSALVAERRAKIAAAAAAPSSHPPVPEAAIQAASPSMGAWRFPAALPVQPSLWPVTYSPSALHNQCQPISTRLALTAASPSPHSAASSTAPLCIPLCHPGSPLSGIPESDSSAFLSALQQPSDSASAPDIQLSPAASAAQPTGSRQPSSWHEAAHPLPLQQAAGSRGLTQHHLHPLPQQAAVQQLPVRFIPACAPAAPSRLGLQTWQQPQEQAACNPQLALRVEALRLKLRAQAAELKAISEQQQGRRQSRAPAHAAGAQAGGPSSRRAVTRGATFAFPSPSPCGASLALGHGLLTPASSLRCCRTMEVEEESQGEEEEERSRHESTMSYLRMLSRSNTSFCTRLRRSNTQSKSLHDFSPQGTSTCSSMGTRRSILGGMDDE